MLALTHALEAALQSAHAAAAILQTHRLHRDDLIIDQKQRNDLVSNADKEAEEAIINHLRNSTPEFGIVAEETGGRPEGKASWYIDPLDGTTNFLHGIPHYAVSIALIGHKGSYAIDNDTPLAQDTPVVAVVYDPNREELFTALYGVGAWLNQHRLQCSASSELQTSLLATGLPFRDFSFEKSYMPALQAAMHHTRGVRRFGSAALDLAWVACGRYDGYWEMGLAPWDVAAGTLLVREAGGICEDLSGTEPWPINGNLYASNSHIADALYQLIHPSLPDQNAYENS